MNYGVSSVVRNFRKNGYFGNAFLYCWERDTHRCLRTHVCEHMFANMPASMFTNPPNPGLLSMHATNMFVRARSQTITLRDVSALSDNVHNE